MTTATAPRSVDERTIMWKRVGKVFADRPRTAEEAIIEAGLDWEVELRELGFRSPKGNHFIKVPDQYVVVRTDTEKALGNVKSRYQTFSNRHAFDFADLLVDGAGASFESGWEQGGGKVIGLTMKLPDTTTVGGEDAFDQYLMLKTSHDGSSAIQVALQNVRLRCMNQFNTALKRAQRRWSVTHSTSAKEKLQQAREALEIGHVYNEAFQREMEQLMELEMSRDRMERELDLILKANRVGEKNATDIRSSILINLDNSDTIDAGQRTTGYGLLNASTEYFDHLRSYRTAEAGFRVTTEGLGARVNQALADRMLVPA